MSSVQPEALTAALQRFGLERDRMRSALASAASMSGNDLDALEHLEADGPLTQSQLGERLRLTSGGTTVLVDRLERAGWVARHPHPSDRRYLLVELTDHALRSAPAGLDSFHARIAEIAAAVPARHREAILDFLLAAAGAASQAADDLCR